MPTSSSSSSSSSSLTIEPNITGQIGDLILIKGRGLDEVTEILFQDSPADFETLSSFHLDVRVPIGAAYGKIKLISTLVNPPISVETSYFFAPLPVIKSLDSYQGYYNDVININGDAFTQVTGVELNNLNCSFSIIDNNNISFVVPRGNTRGKLKVFGQEGLTSQSDFDFHPLISITGFSPTSPKAGDPLIISGKYFLSELSSTRNPGHFEVNFFAGGISGRISEFKIIDELSISGLIPTAAKAGEITILY